VRMRQALELYANLRPCRSVPHPSSRPDIDLVIVRENTEGLYSGIERLEAGGERAVTERVITRKGSERILRKAFDLARQTDRRTVHVVHKANVLRQTCGLFRSVAIEVAKGYPEITMYEMLVDTCAMELVRAPEQFELIATTNLFGDILSDEACMFVGGLGLAIHPIRLFRGKGIVVVEVAALVIFCPRIPSRSAEAAGGDSTSANCTGTHCRRDLPGCLAAGRARVAWRGRRARSGTTLAHSGCAG